MNRTKQREKQGKFTTSSQRTVDLHGRTTAEAKEILISTLDRCIIDDVDQIRIIHGRGTGKVKETVHKTLREFKQVKRFVEEMGNAGVTIVYL